MRDGSKEKVEDEAGVAVDVVLLGAVAVVGNRACASRETLRCVTVGLGGEGKKRAGFISSRTDGAIVRARLGG